MVLFPDTGNKAVILPIPKRHPALGASYSNLFLLLFVWFCLAEKQLVSFA